MYEGLKRMRRDREGSHSAQHRLDGRVGGLTSQQPVWPVADARLPPGVVRKAPVAALTAGALESIPPRVLGKRETKVPQQ